jgi:hypothetical protein
MTPELVGFTHGHFGEIAPRLLFKTGGLRSGSGSRQARKFAHRRTPDVRWDSRQDSNLREEQPAEWKKYQHMYQQARET